MNQVSTITPNRTQDTVEPVDRRITADEFARQLTQYSVNRAARVLMEAEPVTRWRSDLCRRIAEIDEDFAIEVANRIFGGKLAGDLGARTTQHHPKTDYGDTHVTYMDER